MVVPGLRVPGYLVVSATNLMGVYMSPDERAMWTELLGRARLVGRVGYSLFVFRLDAS